LSRVVAHTLLSRIILRAMHRTASFLLFPCYRKGWSKTSVIPTRAPTVTCVIEDDTLTDHSEELRLSHKLFRELWFMT
ncbi:3674_t:CDS:2, partial [Dentiscutata heterogama]